MGLQFDRKKLDSLISQERTYLTRIEELNHRLADIVEKGESINTYLFMSAQHGVNVRNLSLIREEIDSQKRLQLKEQNSGKYPPAFNRWVWGGAEALSSEEKEIHICEADSKQLQQFPGMDGMGFKVPLSQRGTYRLDTRSDIDASAGKGVADEWSSRIIESMSFYGALEQVCTTFRTSHGGDLVIPTIDEDLNAAINYDIHLNQAGEIVQNNPDLEKHDLGTIKAVRFKTLLLSSGPIRLRREAISDVSFSLTSRADLHALRRMSQGWNTQFLLGQGENPQSIITHATAGKAAGYEVDAAGDTAGVKMSDLLAFYSSVPEGYLDNDEGLNGFSMETGRVAGILSLSIHRAMKSTRSATGALLFGGNGRYGRFDLAQNGQAGHFLGHDYYKNAVLTGTTELGTTALFGHFGYYGIRTIGDMELYRFWDSRTAQANAVEVLGFTRRDGKYIGALEEVPKVPGPGNDVFCRAVNKLNITTVNE